MTIRLWDWDKGWANTQTYEGHSHYVMMVAFNPKDANTFASASLDRTIKVWGLNTLQPHFTLEGHEKVSSKRRQQQQAAAAAASGGSSSSGGGGGGGGGASQSQQR